MNPGKLDKRATLQVCQQQKQTDGSSLGVWSDLTTPVWCRVEDLTGRDALVAQQLQISAEKKFTIRTRTLPREFRVVYKSRNYYPSRPPLEVGAQYAYLEIWAKEQTQ